MKDEIPFSSPSSGDLSMCSIPPSPSECGTPASTRGRGSYVPEQIMNTPDGAAEQHTETLALPELQVRLTGQDVARFGESSVSVNVNTKNPPNITFNITHNHAPSENNFAPKKTTAVSSQVGGKCQLSVDRSSLGISTATNQTLGPNGIPSTADNNSETSQSNGQTATTSQARLQTSESSPIEIRQQLPPVEHTEIQDQRQSVSRAQNGAMSETTVTTVDEVNPVEIADRTNSEEHSSSVYQESVTNRAFAAEETLPKAIHNGDTENRSLTAVLATSVKDEHPCTSRSLEPSTISNGRNKRKANEANAAAEEKQNTKRLKKEKSQDSGRRLTNSNISKLKDFENYAKREHVKTRLHKSTKPHLLLQTVEIEAYKGNWELARVALQNAQENFDKHSRPSAEKLLELAEECKKKEFFLRAVLFQVLSAIQKKAEGRKFQYFVSQRIYDIGRLAFSMLSAPTRPEMQDGVHSKDVAKFVVPLMFELYNKRCKAMGSNAKSNAKDLSWIAVAYKEMENHEEAIRYGKMGRKILQAAYSGETCYRFNCYARLIACIGTGYNGTECRAEAQKFLQEAIMASEKATDFKSETDRRRSIRYIQDQVDRMEGMVAGDGDDNGDEPVKNEHTM